MSQHRFIPFLSHHHLAFTEEVLHTAMAGSTIAGDPGELGAVADGDVALSTANLLDAVRQWQVILKGPSGLMSLDDLRAPISLATTGKRQAVETKATALSTVLFRFYAQMSDELGKAINVMCLRVYGSLYSRGLLGALRPTTFDPLQVRPDLSEFPLQVLRSLVPLLNAGVHFRETTVLEESLTLLEGIRKEKSLPYSRSQDLLLETLGQFVGECKGDQIALLKEKEQSLADMLAVLEKHLNKKFEAEEQVRQEAERTEADRRAAAARGANPGSVSDPNVGSAVPPVTTPPIVAPITSPAPATGTKHLVSGGAQPVDITGFKVTSTGLTPEQLVEKMRIKFGEVRNVLDASGKIIPNRLAIVATRRGFGAWSTKLPSNVTERLHGTITTINLINQQQCYDELMAAEPELDGVVGFCKPCDVALVGLSLRKEFYELAADAKKIWWFFTGQAYDANGYSSVANPIALKRGDIPSNDALFAIWDIISDYLSWDQAVNGYNDGAFVLEAQW